MATGQDAIVRRHAELAHAPFRRRPALLAIGGLVALIVAVLAGVGLGSVAVAPGDTIAILAHRLLPLDLPRTWSPIAETIIWDLRLPRVLEALIVGLGLAVAGTTFQGLLRNPLADPYVLGRRPAPPSARPSRCWSRSGSRSSPSGCSRRSPSRARSSP
jgi:ABC-type enterobactin transport system permease subunit